MQIKKIFGELMWRIVKPLRQREIKSKIFVGSFVDISIERMRWAAHHGNHIAIVGEKWVRNYPKRKIHKQMVFYIHRNRWTELLGAFRKPHIEDTTLR